DLARGASETGRIETGEGLSDRGGAKAGSTLAVRVEHFEDDRVALEGTERRLDCKCTHVEPKAMCCASRGVGRQLCLLGGQAVKKHGLLPHGIAGQRDCVAYEGGGTVAVEIGYVGTGELELTLDDLDREGLAVCGEDGALP